MHFRACGTLELLIRVTVWSEKSEHVTVPSLSVADGAQYRKVYFSSLKAAASLALKQTDCLSRRDKPFLVPLLGWGNFGADGDGRPLPSPPPSS